MPFPTEGQFLVQSGSSRSKVKGQNQADDKQTPRTHSSAQKETGQVRSQCGGGVCHLAGVLVTEQTRPQEGTLPLGLPGKAEWHPWLPEGAFGKLTGTLIIVH